MLLHKNIICDIVNVVTLFNTLERKLWKSYLLIQKKILNDRFSGDSIIALATSIKDKPYVRSVDAFYSEGSFYVLTYALSEKIKQIADKMKIAFAEWIDNGHNNFDDENTCILQIKLSDGVLFSNGTRYDIDFT